VQSVVFAHLIMSNKPNAKKSKSAPTPGGVIPPDPREREMAIHEIIVSCGQVSRGLHSIGPISQHPLIPMKITGSIDMYANSA
jgi:hypothetical protein